MGACLAAARAIASGLLGRPKRQPQIERPGSGVASVIIKGALSGVLHTLPLLVAQRVARKALHRGPGTLSNGVGGIRVAEDASRGEAF